MRGNELKYNINVTREGRWWMIEVPAIDGLTQVRRLDEVDDQARSLIATILDSPVSTVELGSVTLDVPGVEHLSEKVRELEQLRATAADAEAQASELLRDTAKVLTQAEVPMRDAGSILKVSHQRIQQLTNA